jgi:hypothetical protein
VAAFVHQRSQSLAIASVFATPAIRTSGSATKRNLATTLC